MASIKEQEFNNQAETATKLAGGVIGAIVGVTLSNEDNAIGVKAMHGLVGSGVGVGLFHNLFKGFYGRYAELKMEAFEKKERIRLTSSIINQIQEKFANMSKENAEKDLGEYEVKELDILEKALRTANLPMRERTLEEQFYINAIFQKIKESNTYLKTLIIGN